MYDSPEGWERYHRLVASISPSAKSPDPVPADAPLTAILGDRDEAPTDKHERMGTGHAVDLDRKGYCATAERSKWSRKHDLIPHPLPRPSDKDEIVGPFSVS